MDETTITCPLCGGANAVKSKYCSECGGRLGELSAAAYIDSRVQEALKEKLRDREVAEVIIFENVAKKLIEWGKFAIAVIGGLAGVVVLVLGWLGYSKISDITDAAAKRVEPTVKAAEQRVQAAGQRLKTADSRMALVEADAAALKKRFEKLNADAAQYGQLSGQVDEVQAQVTELASRAGPCAETLAECPAVGCAQEGTPLALLNMLKRRSPAGGATPVVLRVEDLKTLQQLAEARVGPNARNLDAAGRAKLHNLPVGGRVVSEGDLVGVIGYIIQPHSSNVLSGESVNCKLTGPANNDLIASLVPSPMSTQGDGIRIEIIPQGRTDAFEEPSIRRVADAQKPVVVYGQLLYDSLHTLTGMEARFRGSLWEIHPVTDVRVCPTKACPSNAAPSWPRVGER